MQENTIIKFLYFSYFDIIQQAICHTINAKEGNMIFYIELAFLLLFSLLLFISLFLSLIYGGNINALLIRTSIISYLMIIYSNFHLHIVLLIIYFILLYRNDYHKAIIGIVSYLLIIGCIPKLMYSKYDNLVVYIDSDYMKVVLLLFIFDVMVYLLFPLIKRWWLIKHHQLDFKLILGKYIILGKGFLDSGNSSSFKHIPIIFMKNDSFLNNLQTYLPSQKIKCKNINSNLEYEAFLGSISLLNSKMDVYVVFDNKLSIKEDALLNIRLLEWRN